MPVRSAPQPNSDMQLYDHLTGILIRMVMLAALQGFCPSSTACKTFPVALGGFGSRMGSPVDMSAFADLAAYLQPLCGLPACLAADGAHAPIASWFWDGWSPDSAGTTSLLYCCML